VPASVPDTNALIEEAIATQGGTKPKVRGRSRYCRKALVCIIGKTLEEREKYTPKTGLEESMKNLHGLSLKQNGTAIQAMRLMMEILDETPTKRGAALSAEEKRPDVHVRSGLPAVDRTQ
jgi:hypothetical protein